jgi:SAM-dependent methyltransferase
MATVEQWGDLERAHPRRLRPVEKGQIHPAAAMGYAVAADNYERGRPSYPEEAIACLSQELGLRAGRRVLDLAAGTGKLTRALATTGAEMLAVEPVAEMRAKISATLPAAEVVAGTAEDIPLPDASVDAVAVGQAFHWFRSDEALAEIHRVLRRGGRLGLVWNFRDESVPLVAALTEIMESYRGDAPAARRGQWQSAFERTALFGPLEHRRFRLEHELDLEGVVARVTSVSFIAALPEAEREMVATRVGELLRGRERIVLQYRTDVYWCERR